MHRHAVYADVVREVALELRHRMEALVEHGVDPGLIVFLIWKAPLAMSALPADLGHIFGASGATQPRTAPRVRPSTTLRWAIIATIRTGITAISEPAISKL
jgi:hypothetical protein